MKIIKNRNIILIIFIFYSISSLIFLIKEKRIFTYENKSVEYTLEQVFNEGYKLNFYDIEFERVDKVGENDSYFAIFFLSARNERVSTLSIKNYYIIDKNKNEIYKTSEKDIIKKGKKRNEIREILILDDIISEKKMQLLWARPKSTKNINKVVKFWKEKMKNNETFTLEYDDREKSRNTLNFTGDREFYAFGTTTLYQSTYGTITKTEDGKYDVDIKVLFQYKDKFDDVKNINPLPDAKQDRKKEFKGGKGFYFETEVKEVQIKQKVSSLDQFGLGRIIENEMQFGEKIYENNKK